MARARFSRRKSVQAALESISPARAFRCTTRCRFRWASTIRRSPASTAPARRAQLNTSTLSRGTPWMPGSCALWRSARKSCSRSSPKSRTSQEAKPLMNMEQLREFVSLENRKRDLDAELKAANQRLDELEDLIIPQFIEAGVPSIAVTVDGSTRTLSIYPDVYASPLNGRPEVAAALKASELGQYVAENYNSNSLTAYVREVWREVLLLAKQQNRVAGEEDVRAALPKPLGEVLKISLVHKLSSRKKA